MAYTIQDLFDDPSLWEGMRMRNVPQNCAECSQPIQGSSFPAPNDGKVWEGL